MTLLYEEETFKIRRCVFNVYNVLGSGHKESVYQNALAQEFRISKINFEEQKNLFDKIKVIPLAYDNKKFNLQTPAVKNLFGQYILSIGRLEEKKNTKEIIKAFELLKSKLLDLKLVLVGRPGT